MIVLGIDCSSSMMSLSLKKNKSLYEIVVHDGFKHSENLMPQIDSLFKMASLSPEDLELIAVASGPGSFTGLRIAMSTAKGLAFGASANIVSVSTLDAYANTYSYFDGAVIPVIDAKKKRFYSSVYFKQEKKDIDLDISAEELLEKVKDYTKILITGPDAHMFTDIAATDARIVLDKSFSSTTATEVIKLGIEKFEKDGSDPKGAGPVYIRKSEAEILRSEKS